MQQAPPQQQVSGPWQVLQQAILQQSAEPRVVVDVVAAVGAAAVMAMASPKAAMMLLTIEFSNR